MSTDDKRDPMATITFPDGERVGVDEAGNTTTLPPAPPAPTSTAPGEHPFLGAVRWQAMVRESLEAHQRALQNAGRRTIRRENHAVRMSPGLFVRIVESPAGVNIQGGSLLRATLWTAEVARELASGFVDGIGNRGVAVGYRAALEEEVARLEQDWYLATAFAAALRAEETLALINGRSL